MTSSFEYMHNVHSYNGNQKIQVFDGNTLSITNIGDLNLDFHNVLISPRLISNFIA